MTTRTASSSDETNSVRYRWGILTDLHLAASSTPAARWHNAVRRDQSRDLLAEAVSHLQELDIEHLLLLGDLADGATAADYDYLFDQLHNAGLPTWPIPGNHDRPTDGSGQFDSAAARTDSELPADRASLTHAVAITGALHGIEGTEGDYSFSLELPTDLRDDELLVVLSHFPLLDLTHILHDAGLANAGDLINRAELAESLTSRNSPVLVLHGHQHIRTHTISNNVLQLGFAALAEQPHDLATLDLSLQAGAPGSADSIIIDVRRRCYPLHSPPPNRTRSLLDPDETTFAWSRDSWRQVPWPGSE